MPKIKKETIPEYWKKLNWDDFTQFQFNTPIYRYSIDKIKSKEWVTFKFIDGTTASLLM